VIGETDRIVRPVVAARIPGAGRGNRAGSRQHAGETLGPGILDIERDGVRQEALEQLRRLIRRIERVEPIFLGNAEIVAEASISSITLRPSTEGACSQGNATPASKAAT